MKIYLARETGQEVMSFTMALPIITILKEYRAVMAAKAAKVVAVVVVVVVVVEKVAVVVVVAVAEKVAAVVVMAWFQEVNNTGLLLGKQFYSFHGEMALSYMGGNLHCL